MAKQQAEMALGTTVRATFEPGRMSRQYLVEAYGRLLPIRRAPVRDARHKRATIDGVAGGKEGNDEQRTSSNLRAG